MRSQARELFATLGVPIDPDRIAEGLSIADQQIIEIAKAISLDARILIMDEPTAALSGVEVDRLFAVARNLRDRGQRHPVHLPPLRGGLRPLRPDHRHARRPLHLHPRHRRRHDRARSSSEMVGRDIDQLFPKVRRRDRRARADRCRAHPRGRLHRHQLRRARRRDRRTGRPGRRRPDRGRPGGLRHRPLRRRRGPFLGRPVKPADPQAAIEAGHGLRPGGPAEAGAGDGPVGRPQHHADAPAR